MAHPYLKAGLNTQQYGFLLQFLKLPLVILGCALKNGLHLNGYRGLGGRATAITITLAE